MSFNAENEADETYFCDINGYRQQLSLHPRGQTVEAKNTINLALHKMMVFLDNPIYPENNNI